MKEIFNIYLSTNGRINRKQFFFYIFPLILTSGISINLIDIIGEINTFLIIFLLLIFQVIVSIKRLKDTDTSPLFSILILIPVVYFMLILYLFLKEGDVGDNQYGASPNNKIFNKKMSF